MKTRKFFAVLTAAVMCAALVAGFGGRNVAAAEGEVTAESLLANHFEALASVESASYEMVLDMDMSMSIFGFSQKIDMDIVVDVETFGDNAHVSGLMSNSSVQDGEEMLEEREVEQYVILEGEEYGVYSYDKEADMWTKWTTEVPTFSLDMIPKFEGSDFALEEGEDVYIVSGTVDLLEALEALPDMFSDLTTSFGDLSGYDGETYIEYVFDKATKELKGVKVDMAQALKEILDQSMAEAIAAFGEAFAESEEEVDLATLFSADFNSFLVEIKDLTVNQGSEIVLPDEAKNAVDDTYTYVEEGEEEGEAAEGGTGFATLPKG